MMNREYMKQTYADNLTAWREYRAQIAQDAETLCEIVQNHRFNDGTPEQAAREIVQAIGAENARVIIASAVNAHEGDGRLSATVIEWAQGIGWDWEMSCNLGLTLDSKMHMCHINQTAEALMNLPEDEPEQPETEPAEADETETNEQEDETMYSYTETMNNDILDYIAENIERGDYIDNREELEELLNDDLFCEDSVTGNASGSYFCNAFKARESFQNDSKAADYFAEACDCFDIDAAEVGRHFIRADYEWIDCTIRCYLLGGMISAVLDELEESGYFDESETDTSDIIDTVRAEIA